MEEKKKKIFAIAGMCGGGKTEAIEYLQEKFHWPKVYLPEALFEEINKLGLERNWKNEKKMRVGLRKKQGKGVFAKLSLDKIKNGLKQSDVVLIESLYSWSEYKIIKRIFGDAFKVIAIYSSPAVRFSRLRGRKVRPMKTYKEFEERDASEIEVAEKGGPIAAADYMVINEGTKEEFKEKLDRIMEKEEIIKNIAIIE
ncbi:MAG: AAA family ATPase [Patescibacteria group bacterium]|nr:AAA family ATPase [Patescibacteria group bacterium]